MADYQAYTWVEKQTKVGPTRMNAIEQALQDAAASSKQRGPLANRPAAAAANKNWFWIDSNTGQISYSDGTNWYSLTGGAAASPATPAAFPANPVNGQRVLYEASKTTAGATITNSQGTPLWEFQYDSGTGYWRHVGGDQLIIASNGNFSPGSSQTAYYACGHSFAVPWQGDWEVVWDAGLYAPSNTSVFVTMGAPGFAANDNDSVRQGNSSGTINTVGTRRKVFTGLAQGAVIQTYYRDSGVACQAYDQRTAIKPLRCK